MVDNQWVFHAAVAVPATALLRPAYVSLVQLSRPLSLIRSCRTKYLLVLETAPCIYQWPLVKSNRDPVSWARGLQ